MKQNFLTRFEDATAAIWPLPEAEKISAASVLFRELLIDPVFQTDLIAQLQQGPGPVELLRSAAHGFVLTGYADAADQYRAPHNHGDGLVLYGIVDGEMEMSTYGFNGQLELQERYTMRPGDFKIYRPGDIHDTRGVASRSVVLRFTSCDLKQEERAGRMKRF